MRSDRAPICMGRVRCRVPDSLHAGALLAGRYRLDELLAESAGGRFWRAHDQVLDRPVAVHVIARADTRADGLLEAARRTAPHHDRRLLRVLDADRTDELCYVVNEWGSGTSLDIMLAGTGPLLPRRAAWVVSEVADSLARAHDAGLDHGRMVPENVLIDRQGQVRIIGFAVDAALHGLAPGRQSADLVDTVAVLYAALTGKWAGVSVLAAAAGADGARRGAAAAARARRDPAPARRPVRRGDQRRVRAHPALGPRPVDHGRRGGRARRVRRRPDRDGGGRRVDRAGAHPGPATQPTQPIRRIEPMPPSPVPAAEGWPTPLGGRAEPVARGTRRARPAPRRRSSCPPRPGSRSSTRTTTSAGSRPAASARPAAAVRGEAGQAAVRARAARGRARTPTATRHRAPPSRRTTGPGSRRVPAAAPGATPAAARGRPLDRATPAPTSCPDATGSGWRW